MEKENFSDANNDTLKELTATLKEPLQQTEEPALSLSQDLDYLESQTPLENVDPSSGSSSSPSRPMTSEMAVEQSSDSPDTTLRTNIRDDEFSINCQQEDFKQKKGCFRKGCFPRVLYLGFLVGVLSLISLFTLINLKKAFGSCSQDIVVAVLVAISSIASFIFVEIVIWILKTVSSNHNPEDHLGAYQAWVNLLYLEGILFLILFIDAIFLAIRTSLMRFVSDTEGCLNPEYKTFQWLFAVAQYLLLQIIAFPVANYLFNTEPQKIKDLIQKEEEKLLENTFEAENEDPELGSTTRSKI